MKTNNLNHFKIFPQECDIFSGRVLARLYRRVIFYQFLLFRHWVVYRKRSFDLTLSLGEGRGEVPIIHIDLTQCKK